MSYLRVVRTLGPAVLLCLVAVAASADVKILLKNDMSIFAEECQDQGDRLLCYKMGGSFEVEKKDILSVKKASPGGEVIQNIRREGAPAASGSDKGKKAEDGKDSVKKDGAMADGKPASAEKAADPKVQKMQELQAEREKLVKERERLKQDVKDSPDWMPTQKYEDLSRRNADLDEKIKRYNEDANKFMGDDKKTAPADPKK